VKASTKGGLILYASWNGATQVASWRVLEGANPSSLQPVAQVARSGFETTIATPHGGSYVAAQALGADGTVLGTSSARASAG
jgi:hypothetical protein